MSSSGILGSGGYCLQPEPSCRVRWAVNVTRWTPYNSNKTRSPSSSGRDSSSSSNHSESVGEEMEFLLSLLPVAEQDRVRRFRRLEDKKRALVSRLLQRACVGVCCNLSVSESDIRRTKGGKPFLYNGPVGVSEISSQEMENAPNFNFNVSHEGDFVVLASEPVCIVGVDVAAPAQVRRRHASNDAEEAIDVDYLRQSFGRTCSAREWEAISNEISGEEQEAAFRRHWSCKEAFVKARGDGLGFELHRAEFEIKRKSMNRKETFESCTTCNFETSLNVDNVPASRWAFHVCELGGGHWVTVARGPPSDIVDAHGVFKSTLGNIDGFREETWNRELHANHPPFTLLSVGDLVPADLREEFEEAGGDVW